MNLNKVPAVDCSRPIVIIVIGMAGSGKTTMMKALHAHFSHPSVIGDLPIPPPLYKAVTNHVNTDDEIILIPDDYSRPQPDDRLEGNIAVSTLMDCSESHPLNQNSDTKDVTEGAASSSSTAEQKTEGSRMREKLRTYVLNLDPAVQSTPYPVNIDIRDTINYKQVMKEYKLGPNGAILTSLNLFATKFDQVLELLEKRSSQVDVILVDTPGQIEAFNWSASGSIILDSLAVSFPTMVLYVVDTPRCKSPVTFMSNMIYACSVLYKSKLPFIMAFNKIDVTSSDVCFKWMQSYNSYADDLVEEGSYMASLSRSCALVMTEFYEGIRSVGVSAATQLGMVQLEACISHARDEYFREYLPRINEQRSAVIERREKLARQSLNKFTEDRLDDREEKRQLDELRAKVEAAKIRNSGCDDKPGDSQRKS